MGVGPLYIGGVPGGGPCVRGGAEGATVFRAAWDDVCMSGEPDTKVSAASVGPWKRISWAWIGVAAGVVIYTLVLIFLVDGEWIVEWNNPAQIAWNAGATIFSVAVLVALFLPRSRRQRNPTVLEVVLAVGFFVVGPSGYFLPVGSLLALVHRWWVPGTACLARDHDPKGHA